MRHGGRAPFTCNAYLCKGESISHETSVQAFTIHCWHHCRHNDKIFIPSNKTWPSNTNQTQPDPNVARCTASEMTSRAYDGARLTTLVHEGRTGWHPRRSQVQRPRVTPLVGVKVKITVKNAEYCRRKKLSHTALLTVNLTLTLTSGAALTTHMHSCLRISSTQTVSRKEEGCNVGVRLCVP